MEEHKWWTRCDREDIPVCHVDRTGAVSLASLGVYTRKSTDDIQAKFDILVVVSKDGASIKPRPRREGLAKYRFNDPIGSPESSLILHLGFMSGDVDIANTLAYIYTLSGSLLSLMPIFVFVVSVSNENWASPASVLALEFRQSELASFDHWPRPKVDVVTCRLR